MRAKIEINKEDLITAINEVEKEGALSGVTYLYKKVSETQWAKDNNITSSVIGLRIKEFGIEIKTKRAKKTSISQEHIQKMQEGRFKGDKKSKEKDYEVSNLVKITPKIYQGTVKKIGKGSFSAAIKLKCLECSGFYVEEVKNCPVKNCSLWNFRPYKEGGK